MAEIYLCDDERAWLDRMEQAVTDYMVGSDWALKIVSRASRPCDLLSNLSQNETVDGIYFLDIDLKSEQNGIELGARIRGLDPEAVLIFVTTHDELVMETFRLKLQAMDYIVKDSGDFRSQICSALDAVEKRCRRSSENTAASRIRFSTDGSCHYCLKSEIYFVESLTNRHKLQVHLRSEVFTLSCSLQDVAEQLGDSFILCRRGCLVNPLHITGMNRRTREITLDNGECCPCSHRAWRLVTERIENYEIEGKG